MQQEVKIRFFSNEVSFSYFSGGGGYYLKDINTIRKAFLHKSYWPNFDLGTLYTCK